MKTEQKCMPNKEIEPMEGRNWGWYSEPIQVTEEKRYAKAMIESLEAAHEITPLRGEKASTESAYKACIGCMKKPYCEGCIKKYGKISKGEENK